jgi:hypothetical protein
MVAVVQVVHLEGVAHVMETDMGTAEEVGLEATAEDKATVEDKAMAEDKAMEWGKVALAAVIPASIRDREVTTGA